MAVDCLHFDKGVAKERRHEDSTRSRQRNAHPVDWNLIRSYVT